VLENGKGDILSSTQRAARQAQRLGTLVETLLDMSRVSAGRIDLERVDLDLAEIARDIASQFVVDGGDTDGQVGVDAPCPVRGSWDRGRIEGVLSNLLANAIKYGLGKPVVVSVRSEEKNAVVSVRDEGIGIAEADQVRIFERFERAVSPRHYGGLGLGLWIAKEIVRAHDGEIKVDSRPGAGATFTVVLPNAAEGQTR
jgi:signal transduction histidine kinase